MESRDPESFSHIEQIEYIHILKNILDDKLLLEDEVKIKKWLIIFKEMQLKEFLTEDEI